MIFIRRIFLQWHWEMLDSSGKGKKKLMLSCKRVKHSKEGCCNKVIKFTRYSDELEWFNKKAKPSSCSRGSKQSAEIIRVAWPLLSQQAAYMLFFVLFPPSLFLPKEKTTSCPFIFPFQICLYGICPKKLGIFVSIW